MKIVVELLLLNIALALTNEDFILSNNKFAASVYKEISKNSSDNILVSPLSAEIILALAQSGAKDETAQEIQTSLSLPNDQKQIEEIINASYPSFKDVTNSSIDAANKIYVRNDYKIKEEFRKIASDLYRSDLENIDFDVKDEAAKTMNRWVELQTNNKIQNLIDPKMLNNRTKLVLINSLCFKGNWTNPFPFFYTTKENFYYSSEQSITVDTMHDYDAYYNYYDSEELKAKFLEIPFQGDNITMTVVLPNDRDGLPIIENQIDKVLQTPEFTKHPVNVALPRFKIENKLDLKKVLQSLGVVKAFEEQVADFSGIAGDKGDLFISDIIQKSFIDVDEKGVEATAATFIIKLYSKAGFWINEPSMDFIVDHPFIFYIKVKDVIIFVGRVLIPQS